jgi:hypothetical protein
MLLPLKMRASTRNIGILETRLHRSSVEVAKKWLAWESLKQEAGQRLRLHFLLESQFILDSSACMNV